MLRLFVASSLFVAALMAAFWPGGVDSLLGFSPLQSPPFRVLDTDISEQDRSSPRFLEERDAVVLTVDEETTLGDLLRRLHLRDEWFRRQIVQQLGLEQGDASVLEAGTEIHLDLTPEASPDR